MDWTVIMKFLETTGPMGIIAGIMMWVNIKQADKLTQIIESNTKAMTEMRDVISNMCNNLRKD